MASLIQRIGRLAVQAFNRESSTSLQMKMSYIKQLEELVSSVTSSDLAIDPTLLQDDISQNSNSGSFRADGRAPVIYMQLYEDADVNICVFILRRGVRMPMHDHPGMHGLLKVVHGGIAVQSYTLLGESGPHNLQCAAKHAPVKRTTDHPPLSLTPDRENLHEIVSLDGPAAFLDILSPPYGEDRRMGFERDCHYFREVDVSGHAFLSGLDVTKIWLAPIASPSDFWCDQAEYRGPPLKGVIERGKPH
ncbi:Cysteine oxygenase/2-aminoethanethiol dioxygenase [Trinorchestia longiramus]|nr:Cysteine oxygenase/2-aminoethanethiol dioxygenase [Trinorchestia longiramus]